jgi:hypothetical protein
VPIEVGVEGLPDDAHPTLADLLDQPVVRQHLAWVGTQDASPLCRSWDRDKLGTFAWVLGSEDTPHDGAGCYASALGDASATADWALLPSRLGAIFLRSRFVRGTAALLVLAVRLPGHAAAHVAAAMLALTPLVAGYMSYP